MVDAALTQHPDAELFQSFPGVGLITAATLLSEIGEDRDRFSEAAMLLSEAGLAPVTRRSGNTRRVRVNCEIARRSDLIGIYPNDHSLIRLATSSWSSSASSGWSPSATQPGIPRPPDERCALADADQPALQRSAGRRRQESRTLNTT